MGLARDLVELEARIRERADVDLFAPIDRGGLLATPECAAVAARMRSTDSLAAMRLCLQALRIQHEELRPKLLDAELVATLPPETPGIARPTERVVREMIERAVTEIILLGYELTDRDLVHLLAASAARGINVIMICDRGRGTAARVLDAWPSGTRPPRVFHDRERQDGVPYASMHAKCLLVDSNDLLVTSANFTFHGLHGNIEIGIRLSGAPAAEARKIFSHLVESRILEDVSC
ncbi:phospholipase D-like domain-containing protein [Polyangium sp. y55x31]|uniref:phospholipase D-like domain-containing protein n=1 Tax=Polyangium sp. y55x31 TaxID=3042688 RepID=UPI0024831FEE|nr:phospholipase D-like domain-containing protein [Polyangium sp. y55x31]MDI1480387.1 phospholipase D-like domain-containing protein [Polyangium sp. y55x31]